MPAIVCDRDADGAKLQAQIAGGGEQVTVRSRSYCPLEFDSEPNFSRFRGGGRLLRDGAIFAPYVKAMAIASGFEKRVVMY